MFDPKKHQDMLDKCCRLGFLLSKEKIDTIFKVYGDDIEIFDNTGGENKELGEPAEPKHGWYMQKPEEGYPCTALTRNGCKFQGKRKPWRCKQHPTVPPEKTENLIKTCSFKFDKNGKRRGSCDRCKGAK